MNRLKRRNSDSGERSKSISYSNSFQRARMTIAAMNWGGGRFRRTIVFGTITAVFFLIIVFKIFDRGGGADFGDNRYAGAYDSKYVKHPKLIEPRKGLNAWGQTFMLDNEPFRILSGSMHYFRVVPEYWRDRLRKMRACGLNTVMTYVPWNAHEESRGMWNFKGILNLALFLQIAQEEDLYVILRPGPYICAEWEFGGLPAWLLEDPEMRVRSVYPPFLRAVDSYFDELIPMVVPWQYQKGGPIIAVQVENEYGSYGYDLQYLTYIKDALEKRGISELLMTSDGASHLNLGSIPSVFATVNFVNSPIQSLEALKLFQPDRPLMVAEFWSGWFDHWGEQHHVQHLKDFKKAVTIILEKGASVNFYMFHGGTNFGFMNGANTKSDDLNGYEPTISSYDYDAPISENGQLTEKYIYIKSLLWEYASDYIPVRLPTPMDIPSTHATAYGVLEITEYAGLTDTLSLLKDVQQKVKEAVPMELLPSGAQSYGYIMYRKKLSDFPYRLQFSAIVMDTAWVFVNGMACGSVTWMDTINLSCSPAKAQSYLLEILVENTGRVNYGVRVGAQWKGIIGPVSTATEEIRDWTIFPITMKEKFINGLWGYNKWKKLTIHAKVPGFFHALLHLSQAPRDTFLYMKAWGRGVVFVNGRNIGRYRRIGPQHTLYIPAPLLKVGQNQITVFELERMSSSLIFKDHPDLGSPTVMHVHIDSHNKTTVANDKSIHTNP